MAISDLKTELFKTAAKGRERLKSLGFKYCRETRLWWTPNTWPMTPEYAVIVTDGFVTVARGNGNDVKDFRDAMARIKTRRCPK